ncbi:MAG: hypothetical protein JJU00_08765 [Opitutales bacterium]|nr:hypothetical protein [Opitutales bacterium]
MSGAAESHAPVPESAAAGGGGAWEREVVDFYIHLAQAFSLPKSVGAIFGILFASPRALALDDIVERLSISKGSASSGLKLLQRVGAVQPTYEPGDRRTRYVPEMSIRRLLTGLLQETVTPHLRRGAAQLESLAPLLNEFPPDERKILAARLRALNTWQGKAKRLLPFVLGFLGRPLRRAKIDPGGGDESGA